MLVNLVDKVQRPNTNYSDAATT